METNKTLTNERAYDDKEPTNVRLVPKLKKLAQEAVVAGTFTSVSDVINKALDEYFNH